MPAVELELALIREAEVAGAVGQLFDHRRDENLATASLVGDARGQDDVLAVEVGFLPYRLPRVEPDAQPDGAPGVGTELRVDRVLDRAGTLDGAARAGERDHEPVALGLHLESAMGVHQLPHDCVVRAEQLQPAHVAQALIQRCRPLDVGEKDRDGAVGRRGRPQARALRSHR